jgi:hypothetical protein
MGTALDTITLGDLPRSDLKKKFAEATEEARYENGHGGYTGTIAEMSTIARFVDRECASRDEAENHIGENHNKWDQAMAVSFREDGKKRWVVGGFCSE